tara:strand:+ start:2196 stop:2861 length:666 start_codon:yes stop_codon:yes gene_type:complete
MPRTQKQLESRRTASKKWREANREKVREYSKKWKEANREKWREIRRRYKNGVKGSTTTKLYEKANRLKRNQRQAANHKKRIQEDSSHRLKHNLRSSLHKALKKQNGKKSQKTHEYLGCTLEWFVTEWWPSKIRAWNEMYPDQQMALESGDIQMDHIKPCRAFEDNEMHECFHYTNLQPLPKAVNSLKSDTWGWEDECHWRCNILYNERYIDPYLPVEVILI